MPLHDDNLERLVRNLMEHITYTVLHVADGQQVFVLRFQLNDRSRVTELVFQADLLTDESFGVAMVKIIDYVERKNNEQRVKRTAGVREEKVG
jgi:hypothetical protein